MASVQFRSGEGLVVVPDAAERMRCVACGKPHGIVNLDHDDPLCQSCDREWLDAHLAEDLFWAAVEVMVQAQEREDFIHHITAVRQAREGRPDLQAFWDRQNHSEQNAIIRAVNEAVYSPQEPTYGMARARFHGAQA